MWLFVTRGSLFLGDVAARYHSRPDVRCWILFEHDSHSADMKHLVVWGFTA